MNSFSSKNLRHFRRGRLLLLSAAALSLACLLVPNLAFAATDTITTPGASSWACPASVTSVTVQCWGAGGGGGGNDNSPANTDGGGGGGGGAYSSDTYSVSNPNSYNYTVGGGGGGVATGTGGVGGDTWWINGTTIMAKGGSGGGTASGGTPGTGGAGGVGTSGYGTTRFNGGAGEGGYNNSAGAGGWGGSSGGTAANGYYNGAPPSYTGTPPYINTYPTGSTPAGAGHGGDGGTTANGSNPVAGQYGGGGGGSGEGAGSVGGNGADGKIILTFTATTTVANNQNQPGTVQRNQTDQVIGIATFQNDGGTSDITAVTVSELSAYTANGNITNVEVCWNTSAAWNASNQIGSASSTWSSEAITFTETFTSSATLRYLIVRADVAAGATLSTGLDFSIGITTTENTSGSPLNFTGTTEVLSGPEKDLNIYYSVGTTATALYGPTGSISTSSKGVMQLSGTPASNIGVGDEVQVGSNRYYIRRRDNSTDFRIQNSAANGGTPGDTNITFSNQTVSIYRAFNSLNAAVNTANAVDAADANHLNTATLTTNSNILHIACYGDGVDATSATVDGWTTSSTSYIRIFTPTASTEVGTTQRHAGVWDTNKYHLSMASNDVALRIYDKDVQVDGLQIRLEVVTANDCKGILIGELTTIVYDVRVSNCIIRGVSTSGYDWHSGIETWNNVAGFTGTLKAWNNIIYDFAKAGTNFGIQANTTGSYTIYAYNNTIYNCGSGLRIDQSNGTGASITAKNNILQKCGDGITGNNITETYTVTDLAEGLAGTGSDNSKTVLFVDSNATPRNLHLQSSDTEAKDAGTNASDGNISFSTDIDGATRSGTWDIGADEVAPEKDANIYYSVGTNTGALYSANASASSKGVMVLASAGATNIGVGDEVRVGSNRYYIRRRDSETDFRIQNSCANGGIAGDTAITFASQAITIYRAFNSLNAAEAGASGANYLNTANLTTNSNILHFACYGDGADNTATTVDGYTTSATSYIGIFTPTASTEVGVSQRHAGAWTTSSKYYLSVSNGTALTISDAHVRVTGLQIAVAAVNGNSQMGINVTGTGGSADSIWISHCIIKGTNAGSNTNHIGLQLAASGTGVCKIWNNIIYDFGPAGTQTTDYGAYFNDADYTTYFYNNTIYNCCVGLGQAAGTVVAKNNIVTGITQTANTNTYIGTFGAGTDYNSTNSTDAIGAGSNNKTGQTIGFVSSSDLHLVTGDVGAKSQGTNLSADGNIAITDDIDGATRTVTWCIGADENDAVAEKDVNIYYSVGTTATALYNDNAAAIAKGILDLASNAATNVGVGDEVRVGSNRFYIRSRIAADSFRIENSTANSGTPGDTNITFASQAITIYRAFNSLFAAEANAGDASHLNTSNLTTNSNILHLACYGDGVDNTAAYVSGWTTSATSYIRIFTPVSTTEVGATQRHSGIWTTSKYYRNSNGKNVEIGVNYVRVDGLQISAGASDDNGHYGIAHNGARQGIYVTNCIIRLEPTVTFTSYGDYCMGIDGGVDAAGDNYYYNNIIYGFNNPGNTFNYGFTVANHVAGKSYFYNNTVVNCSTGVRESGYGDIIAKNNIVQSCSNGFYDACGAGSDYNVSDIAGDAPSASYRSGQATTVTFVGGSDYHLGGGDTYAKDQGTSLSGTFTTDIDGATRSGTWDLGADEAPTDVTAPTNVGLSSPANGATGVSTTPTLTVLTATDADAGLHATPYYIELATNSSFTTGTQNSGWQAGTTWAPTLSGATTYYWRVKARDALSNTSSLCGFTADAAGYGSFTTATGTGTYSTYSYFDTLYFNTTSTGANVPDAVSNFPVLVRFTTATFPFSQAQGDGDDIRFLDADGTTTLSHERERYDSTNGVAEFWVLVPSVSGNSTSDFIIRFWGNSSASTASSPENTFQTSNGFQAVLHLSENGDEVGEDYLDATSNNNDGQGGNGTAADVPTQATGIIGKGQTYNDITDYINVDDHASLNASTPMMSGWLKPNPTITAMGMDYPAICWHDNYNPGRGVGFGNCITGTSNENTLSYRINGISGTQATVTVSDNSTWVYVVGKYDGSNIKIYRNAGVAGGSDSVTTAYSTAVTYANDALNLGWMVGSLDEYRLESTARSAQWIRLCYENQKAAQTLIRYSLKTLYYSVGTTATAMYSDNASASSGTLTLASAAVDSIGLGDEVRVGSNRYYIRSRSSSTSFGIQNSAANSGIVGDTAITFTSQAITIYRAFNSLDNAVDAVDGGVSANDASHANTANLALNNYQLNIVCYADGVDNTAATVNGWTTSSTNYIRIYTPTATTEVGKTQRHAGVWSTSKYHLSLANAKALTISDENVRVEGLQIQVSGTNASDQSCVYISGATGTCDHRVSCCLIRGRNTGNTQVNHAGIHLTGSGTGTLKVWNNVIYDFAEGGNAGNVYLSDANYTSYIYNNTLYNGYGFGLWFDAGSVIAKNNIVANTGVTAYTYDGSFSAGTDYNAATTNDAIGAGSNNRISQTFTFVTAGSNFHLSNSDAGAKDYGTNLSADANLAFSTDIEGETRQGTWDIGADEAPPTTNIFYSVGTRTAALYSGNAYAAGGLMTLSGTGSDTIGVGDEVRVGSNRYYITQRYSNTNYDIQSSAANSGTPGATSITFSEQAITIYRAFNALDDAVDAVDGGSSANDASHLNSANLVAGNYILNIACYGDGIETGNVVVDGWTTGAANYIRIYTPTATAEVGLTQRHDGKLDSTNAYLLRCGTINTTLIDVRDNYVRIDGIQIDAAKTGNTGINGISSTAAAACDIRVSNCILKGPLCPSTGIGQESGTGPEYIWNNIIYDWKSGGGGNGIGFWSTAGNGYAYNNTVYNCSNGFSNVASTVDTLINNISYSCTDNYQATAAYGGNYNLSGPAADGNMPGANSRSATVTFVSTANSDFHITTGDAGAKDYGTSLAADAHMAFSTDIDGTTRTGTWDIGADESYTAPKVIYYSVGTTATALYDGTGSASSGTLTITTSSASNTIGLGDEVRQGANEYYISSRSSSTSFGIQTPVGSTAITFADGAITIYRAFNSLSAAEAGASGANYLNTTDLVTGGFQLHLACYGDGEDGTATTIDGYTTGPDNYIRIFTPTAATEVGTSQRHSGTWNTSGKYRLVVSSAPALYGVIAVYEDFVRIEGLQVHMNFDGEWYSCVNFAYVPAGSHDLRTSHCILRGNSGTTYQGKKGINSANGGYHKIWNNVIYDIKGGSGSFSSGGIVTSDPSVSYVYNNTLYNNKVGILIYSGTGTTAINNLAQKCTDGFDGTFTGSSDYNISDVASDAPGSHSKNSSTVAFVDSANDNFHLQATDAVARGAGVDLSTDPNLSFLDDIDTKTRYSAWDIGADQYWDEPGLAVTMDAFFAKGGDANDTISWRTQSEKDNYGFNIYRRIKPAFWQAKMAEDESTVNRYQLTAGIEGRKAKNGKMPEMTDGSAVNRSPLTVNSYDSLSVNRSPVTVNLFKDKFGNDTTWKLVNVKPIPGAKGGRSVGPRNYRIIDYGVENGITYEYTIEDIDYSSVRIRHGIAEATPTKRLPKTFALHPNYPNPFNPITVITYDLPKTCRVDISVYDLRGRKITTLVSASQMKEAGFYKIVWTGKDTYNRPVASGVYLYRIQAGEFVKLRKMTLLK